MSQVVYRIVGRCGLTPTEASTVGDIREKNNIGQGYSASVITNTGKVTDAADSQQLSDDNTVLFSERPKGGR